MRVSRKRWGKKVKGFSLSTVWPQKDPEDIKLVDEIGDTKWDVWLIDDWEITVNEK